MSFFEKLKGSANVPEEPKEEEKKKEEGKKKKRLKEKTAAPPGDEPRPEKSGREIKPGIEPEKKSPTPKKPDVLTQEEPQTGGQLALDIYETEGDFIIQSTVAGVKPENLDISIEGDLVSVRGTREKTIQREEGEGEGKYLYQECYWGEFSREVILPEEVDASKAEAKIKDGVLTLKIPKTRKTKRKKIAVTTSE